jgi:hypothetical protein
VAPVREPKPDHSMIIAHSSPTRARGSGWLVRTRCSRLLIGLKLSQFVPKCGEVG